MRAKHSAILIAIAASAAVSIGCVSSEGQTTQPDRPMSLHEISQRGIEGLLGIRLGTIVTIEGEVVANQSRSKMDSVEPFFLRIDSIDGRPLTAPVQYRFTPSNMLRSIKRPKVGDKFRYVGYETGEFVGSPKDEAEYLGELATTDFLFRTRFEIIADKPK